MQIKDLHQLRNFPRITPYQLGETNECKLTVRLDLGFNTIDTDVSEAVNSHSPDHGINCLRTSKRLDITSITIRSHDGKSKKSLFLEVMFDRDRFDGNTQ